MLRNREEFFNAYNESIRIAEIKILPIVGRGGTKWEIRVFRTEKQDQGPVIEVTNLTPKMLEDALNADFGWLNIDRERIEQINKAREWADNFLSYDTSYNRKERGTADMDELIEMTSYGQQKEWQTPRKLL